MNWFERSQNHWEIRMSEMSYSRQSSENGTTLHFLENPLANILHGMTKQMQLLQKHYLCKCEYISKWEVMKWKGFVYTQTSIARSSLFVTLKEQWMLIELIGFRL